MNKLYCVLRIECYEYALSSSFPGITLCCENNISDENKFTLRILPY